MTNTSKMHVKIQNVLSYSKSPGKSLTGDIGSWLVLVFTLSTYTTIISRILCFQSFFPDTMPQIMRIIATAVKYCTLAWTIYSTGKPLKVGSAINHSLAR